VLANAAKEARETDAFESISKFRRRLDSKECLQIKILTRAGASERRGVAGVVLVKREQA
jgi:hypothetical protein